MTDCPLYVTEVECRELAALDSVPADNTGDWIILALLLAAALIWLKMEDWT